MFLYECYEKDYDHQPQNCNLFSLLLQDNTLCVLLHIYYFQKPEISLTPWKLGSNRLCKYWFWAFFFIPSMETRSNSLFVLNLVLGVVPASNYLDRVTCWKNVKSYIFWQNLLHHLKQKEKNPERTHFSKPVTRRSIF